MVLANLSSFLLQVCFVGGGGLFCFVGFWFLVDLGALGGFFCLVGLVVWLVGCCFFLITASKTYYIVLTWCLHGMLVEELQMQIVFWD